jgi:regulator of cell morphogenesis and NO signaling
MSDTINYSAQEVANLEVASTPNYYDWNCDYLIDYIIQTHHRYVNNAIPDILHLNQKVVEKHGAKYTELFIIQSLFQQLSNEMILHMKKEELVLFPLIKKLYQADLVENNGNNLGSGSIKSPISVIEIEHETAGIMVKRINKLSNNYTPPDDTCQTFRLLFDKLKDFETDVHVHVHLENDILHPKVIELEKALLVG